MLCSFNNFMKKKSSISVKVSGVQDLTCVLLITTENPQYWTRKYTFNITCIKAKRWGWLGTQQLRENTTLAEFLSSVPTSNVATTCNSSSKASAFGLCGHCTPDADPCRPCACCFHLCELTYALLCWFSGPCSSLLSIKNLSRVLWALRGRIWWRPPILTLSPNNVWYGFVHLFPPAAWGSLSDEGWIRCWSMCIQICH